MFISGAAPKDSNLYKQSGYIRNTSYYLHLYIPLLSDTFKATEILSHGLAGSEIRTQAQAQVRISFSFRNWYDQYQDEVIEAGLYLYSCAWDIGQMAHLCDHTFHITRTA